MSLWHEMLDHPFSKNFSCLQLWIPPSNTSPNQHVVVVALNRVHKRNAISAVMWREIGEVFALLGQTGDDCRAIILTGADSTAFTAGIDISDPGIMTVGSEGDVARRGLTFLPKVRDMQRCFTAVEECPVPVIAVIQGSCIGAGVDLACACDIRICSSKAQFSVREVKIGLEIGRAHV